MKKEFIFGITLSAIVMLTVPWIAVTFIPADAGMAACFMLFYAVNPVSSVITGIFAGKDMRHLYGLPVISAFLFLAGAWIFFTVEETAFILYAAVYLALGAGAMLVSNLIRKKMCVK